MPDFGRNGGHSEEAAFGRFLPVLDGCIGSKAACYKGRQPTHSERRMGQLNRAFHYQWLDDV